MQITRQANLPTALHLQYISEAQRNLVNRLAAPRKECCDRWDPTREGDVEFYDWNLGPAPPVTDLHEESYASGSGLQWSYDKLEQRAPPSPIRVAECSFSSLFNNHQCVQLAKKQPEPMSSPTPIRLAPLPEVSRTPASELQPQPESHGK